MQKIYKSFEQRPVLFRLMFRLAIPQFFEAVSFHVFVSKTKEEIRMAVAERAKPMEEILLFLATLSLS